MGVGAVRENSRIMVRRIFELVWTYVIAGLGFLWLVWVEGGLQYWFQNQGTYDPKNWRTWLTETSAFYNQIPRPIVGLILGFALGVCLTGAIYEVSGRRMHRNRQAEETAGEEARQNAEADRQKRALIPIANLCARASNSMAEAELSQRHWPNAEPRIALAKERLEEVVIELDTGLNAVGGVRYEELKNTLSQIAQYLFHGSLKLTKRLLKSTTPPQMQ